MYLCNLYGLYENMKNKMMTQLVKRTFTILLISMLGINIVKSESNEDIQYDVIKTSLGDLKISFLGHSSLLLQLDTLNIYIDPCSLYVCTRDFPKADLIMLTNHHKDHFDRKAISHLFKHEMLVMGTRKCHDELKYISVLNNDGWSYFSGMKIESYHAYNIDKRDEQLNNFNIKWEGNGYVINFGNTRVYISGSTEVIPEMKFVKNIDIALVPLNEETMSADDIVKLIEIVKPKIVYPYQYLPLERHQVEELFKDYDGSTEIRVKECYPAIQLKQYENQRVMPSYQ